MIYRSDRRRTDAALVRGAFGRVARGRWRRLPVSPRGRRFGARVVTGAVDPVVTSVSPVTLATHRRRCGSVQSTRPTVDHVGTGIVFVVLVAIWAAYFLQYWSRRREHLATARSVEAFSIAMGWMRSTFMSVVSPGP